MDYEKKYNGALEKAKQYCLGEPGNETAEILQNTIRQIFPELRESEDEDEAIYREIYSIVHLHYETKADLFASPRRKKETIEQWEKAKDYLEKQKELPFVKDVMLGYPGLYFYDGERMHFRGPTMEEKQKEQKPAELNEEFVERLMDCMCAAQQYRTGTISWDVVEGWAEELNELKKPAEWSEEDKMHLSWIIECFDSWKYQVPEFADHYQSAIDWLKSLRSFWKPSEEQMKALQNAVALTACDKELARLYNQLKKLM